MSQLLSETSKMTRNHGELARAISELPRLTCDELRKETGKAFGSFIRSESLDVISEERERITSVIKGIGKATTAMLTYVRVGDEDQAPPSVNRYFSPLVLERTVESHQRIDYALRGILGKLSCTQAITDNTMTLYPMRIATGEHTLDLIPEISRTEFSLPNGISARHRQVIYDLSFAAFDVEQ